MKTIKNTIWLPVLAIIFAAGACSKQAEKTPEKPEPVAFEETTAPPQFPDCQTEDGKAEQMKCFSKGLTELIVANMKYPKSAHEMGQGGTIYIEIVIDENGKLYSKEIKRSVEKTAENETAVTDMEVAALAVFDEIPTLIPATKDGAPVAINYVVPIKFAMQ